MDALVLVEVVSIWQGILLWKAAPEETQASPIKAAPGTVEHW
jgi:hypothetical protein